MPQETRWNGAWGVPNFYPPPTAAKTSVKAVRTPVGGILGAWTSFLTVCAACASGAVYAADTPWVEESISTHKTGSWSRMVIYSRATGLAPFNGKELVYTPNTPSTGDYVTVNVRMSFSELANGDPSDDDAQAAIHITSNNVFQVWTKPGWLDVAAQGITPVSNVEYAVQFIMDYRAGVYSVAVQDDGGTWRLLRSAAKNYAFPLAVKGSEIKAISFEGKAQFRSLKGSYTSICPNWSGWSKSASPQAPISLIGANRPARRLQSDRLEQIGQPVGSNQFDWGKTDSPQAPIGSPGANRPACRPQSDCLEQTGHFSTTQNQKEMK